MAEVIRHPAAPILRGWTPTRASEIHELPPPPVWIWDSLVLRGQVTLLGGAEKIGKSLLLQQLMSCATLGLPCLGHHTERCRCFGYFCEDTDDWLRRRQMDINAALGIERLDFEDRFHWRSAATDDSVLADFEYGKMVLTAEWDRLWREIEYQEAEFIVIDTARAIFQGNELIARQVTQFMRKLQEKAISGNLAIILAVHPPTGNSAKGYAGSGAWLASARAGLSLERPPEYDPLTDTPHGERVLRGLGANYSGGRAIDRIKWEHGIFVDLEHPEGPPARTDSYASRDIMDREMLHGLIRTRNNGGAVPADWNRAGSMQRRYRATFDARTAWNDLNASFERLIMAREIVRVKVGGECLVRPANGFPYSGEEPWTI